MSTAKRNKVTTTILEKEVVDVELKKQALHTAIYNVTKRDAFIGSIMQCLDITYTHWIPRLGIMFDVDSKKWKMLINPYYFCKQLNAEEQPAVLLHEISHVTHKHPIRVPFLKINPARRQLVNIAMDMVINQYIPNLPYGCDQCPPYEEAFNGVECPNEICPGKCIKVEDYFDIVDDKKVQWPENKSFEFYYEKLVERFQDAINSDENNGKDGENGDGSTSNGGSGNGKGIPKEYDSHHWENSSEETEMLDATEELVKRAIQKQGLSYDKLPGHIKELLSDIEARRAELNYRALILSAIKRNASGIDRVSTWSRQSKRFGKKAPGSKIGELPFLSTYIDSSGSISVQEANDFLDIIDNFLKVGSRKCNLSLWHTNVYYSEKYKLGDRVTRVVFQSGGTDLEPTLLDIKDKDPDLAIILTDGCYSDVQYEEWLKPGQRFPQVLFIISRDGEAEHPLRRLGETIKIPSTDLFKSDRKLEEQ
jgi:predicted metal-dependent peptidase